MKKKQKKENNCIQIASFSCPLPNGRNRIVVSKNPDLVLNKEGGTEREREREREVGRG
jgi:hypothetical protein